MLNNLEITSPTKPNSSTTTQGTPATTTTASNKAKASSKWPAAPSTWATSKMTYPMGSVSYSTTVTKSMKGKSKMASGTVPAPTPTVIPRSIAGNFTRTCDMEKEQWIMAISTSMKGYGRTM